MDKKKSLLFSAESSDISTLVGLRKFGLVHFGFSLCSFRIGMCMLWSVLLFVLAVFVQVPSFRADR